MAIKLPGKSKTCRASVGMPAAEHQTTDQSFLYLSVTAFAADPPKLLRTVMFRGFVGHDNIPVKLPRSLFVNIPMKSPVVVT